MSLNENRFNCAHRLVFSRFIRGVCGAGMVALFGLTAMGAEPPPPSAELAAAAQAALKKFLPALDSGVMKKTHGFAPEDDFKDLRLGDPFELMILTSDAIGEYKSGAISSVLAPSGSWYFPVLTRGQVACLVSVARGAGGTLVEDKLGMPELAHTWAAITQAWPADKGYTPQFIIVPTRQRFYLTVPQVEPPNLTPVNIDAKDAALPQTYQQLKPATEALAFLRS